MRSEPSVGATIRKLREERGYSLRTLAEKCGLSVNAISRIERGANSPTVKSLDQIARALGVSIVSLFAGGSHQLLIFRSDPDAFTKSVGGVLFENLISRSTNLPFECLRITALPGNDLNIAEVSHPGYEFVYCLEGHVDYWINHECISLKEGDCICFDARQPHYWHKPINQSISMLVFSYSSGSMISYVNHHPEVGDYLAALPSD